MFPPRAQKCRRSTRSPGPGQGAHRNVIHGQLHTTTKDHGRSRRSSRSTTQQNISSRNWSNFHRPDSGTTSGRSGGLGTGEADRRMRIVIRDCLHACGRQYRALKLCRYRGTPGRDRSRTPTRKRWTVARSSSTRCRRRRNHTDGMGRRAFRAEETGH